MVLSHSADVRAQVRPGFVRNPAAGKRLEFGLLYYLHDIAIEYNGTEHYLVTERHSAEQVHKRQMIPEIANVGRVYPFLEAVKLAQQVWTPLMGPALTGTMPIQGVFAQAAEIHGRILAEIAEPR
jgi:hypothetical protein